MTKTGSLGLNWSVFENGIPRFKAALLPRYCWDAGLLRAIPS